VPQFDGPEPPTPVEPNKPIVTASDVLTPEGVAAMKPRRGRPPQALRPEASA
jgi:hypothetical protein